MHPGMNQWDIDKPPMKQSFQKFGEKSDLTSL